GTETMAVIGAAVAKVCMMTAPARSLSFLAPSAFPTREKLRCFPSLDNPLVALERHQCRSEQIIHCNEFKIDATAYARALQ
ncbi:hypothetical protein, partial [Streptomyces sp. NPDC056049]|uniref:hypothetical protein n=1 Tax=Streptomyces sp. NPDC056049 TaxID=3345693 RepID=UPI0035D71E5A